MESIEQMIKRLCPNGVEWKKINEVGTIYRGVAFSKKDFTETGTPCIHYGQIYTRFGNSAYKTYTYVSEQLSKGKRLAQKGDLVMAVTSENMEDVGKCLAWLGEEDILVSNHACYIRHSLNPMYLAYYLQSVHFFNYKKKISKGVKVIDLDLNMFGDMLIPVPPMEIQNRIVEVLDKMTTLTAELEAELEARKQQYEYYRNKLLTFNEIGGGSVIWKRLGDILYSIRTGLNPRKFFTLNTPDATNYYVTIKEFKGGNLVFGNNTDKINDEAMRLCNNRSNLEEGDLLFSGTGTIGEVLIVKETPRNWNIKEGVYALKPKLEQIRVGFLKHIMQTSSVKTKLESLSEGGTVKSISMKKLADFVIPVPSMEEQERIVSILDRFESLTTDLQIGLPAEIEARRQQYEYYRNKLLTFDQAA